jgi:hypothetical protein
MIKKRPLKSMKNRGPEFSGHVPRGFLDETIEIQKSGGLRYMIGGPKASGLLDENF